MKEFKDSEIVYVGVIDESGNRHYLYEQEKGGEVKSIDSATNINVGTKYNTEKKRGSI